MADDKTRELQAAFDDAPTLDEILSTESGRLNAEPMSYPYRPQEPAARACPDHPGEDLVRPSNHYAWECPTCRTKVCLGCGTINAMEWFSSLCRGCQDRKYAQDREIRQQMRQDELDHTTRAERVALALEAEDADLRHLLRALHEKDPTNLLDLHTEDGPVQVVESCTSCFEPWPCATRLILDETAADMDLLGEGSAANDLRAAIDAGGLDAAG